MNKPETIEIPSYVLEHIDTYVERGGMQQSTLADEASKLYEVLRSDVDRRLNTISRTPEQLEEEIRKGYVTAGSWDQLKKHGYILALNNANPLMKDLILDLVVSDLVDHSKGDWGESEFLNDNYNRIAQIIELMLERIKRGYVGYLNIRYLRRLAGDIIQPGVLDSERPDQTVSGFKLKWKASPAIFGTLMDELIEKGYIERPTASYSKDVSCYMQIFDIDSTPATLAKELSDRTNSLCADNRAKLTLPKIEQLK